jgi:hypothetical protein
MGLNKPSLSLAAEVAKLAKLSHVQNSLPGAARSLPVVAILAGEIISKATKGRNLVEEHLLGVDETFLLTPPVVKRPTVTMESGHDDIREGILMMCGRCWSHSGRRAAATHYSEEMASKLVSCKNRNREVTATLWWPEPRNGQLGTRPGAYRT